MTKKAGKFIPCVLKQLPSDQLVKAAETAVALNPANSPAPALDRAMSFGFLTAPPRPQELAVLTTKYWGAGGVKLSVGFMDSNDAGLQNKILSYMNHWATRAGANVQFALTASRQSAQVRIARQRFDGYWSYLGTDVLSIPRGQPTMNLDSFTLSTPDEEYQRVVVHETGHTLGFPHEHMRKKIVDRLDREKTLVYFRDTYGWDEGTVVSNVLTPLAESSIMGSEETDELSIMTYSLPGSITKDGNPVVGGVDLTITDMNWSSSLYPNPNPPPPPPPTGTRQRLTLELAGGKVSGVKVISLE